MFPVCCVGLIWDYCEVIRRYIWGLQRGKYIYVLRKQTCREYDNCVLGEILFALNGSSLWFLSVSVLRPDIWSTWLKYPGMNPDDVDFCLQCLLVFVYRETVTFQFSLSFVQSVKLFFCLTDLINLWTMDAMLKSLYFDLKQVRQKNQQHDIYPRCMYLFTRVDPRYISFCKNKVMFWNKS